MGGSLGKLRAEIGGDRDLFPRDVSHYVDEQIFWNDMSVVTVGNNPRVS
jgi:hypothetical protein